MLRLLRARRGLAGLEFAIITPMLVAMLCGMADLSRAIIMARRLTIAASSTAMIASTMAVQARSPNALSGTQALQASTAPFAIFPEWSPGPTKGTFSITLSAVTFVSSQSGTTTHVTWSVANPGGQTRLRSCGALTPTPDDSPSSLASLPVDAFGPTSLLVADVAGVFVPAFTSVFLGPFTLQRSGYVSPRINNGVTLVGAFPGPAVTCPAGS